MSNEITILVSGFTDDSKPSEFQFSEKKKGGAYHRNYDSLHTAQFSFDNFKGSVKLQGSLELYPSTDSNDWVDIIYEGNTGTDPILESADSTPLLSTEIRNFRGNFVWIRAAIMLEQGTVTEIRYNH